MLYRLQHSESSLVTGAASYPTATLSTGESNEPTYHANTRTARQRVTRFYRIQQARHQSMPHESSAAWQNLLQATLADKL
jgi:hypothetical protein